MQIALLAFIVPILCGAPASAQNSTAGNEQADALDWSIYTPSQLASIQLALSVDGYYTGDIDGVTGSQTRNGIRSYLTSIGEPPADELTEAQLNVLLDDFNQRYGSSGIAGFHHRIAGLHALIPTALVAFDGAMGPFVTFRSINQSGIRIALMSLEGDQEDFGALYQSLLAEFKADARQGMLSPTEFSFSNGADGKFTYARARYRFGRIWGMLVQRPLAQGPEGMNFFRALARSVTAIQPEEGSQFSKPADASPATKLQQHFFPAKPDRSFSGFFVDDQGTAVTSANLASGCSSLRIDNRYEVSVLALDTAADLALLAPRQRLYPFRSARISNRAPPANAQVWLGGFSHGGLLGQPTVSVGRASSSQLEGDETLSFLLEVDAMEGDAGGPIVDRFGNVAGMLLPRSAAGSKLPQGMEAATNADAIRRFLRTHDIALGEGGFGIPMTGDELFRAASEIPLLITCRLPEAGGEDDT
ncbi:MAG: trypsin-like peptidase domain-containing protein [Rhodobacteraceae bacterium]|nr:trypsin-like peptidase domain-containing protein [Paracoccaceae bacterium]